MKKIICKKKKYFYKLNFIYVIKNMYIFYTFIIKNNFLLLNFIYIIFTILYLYLNIKEK